MNYNDYYNDFFDSMRHSPLYYRPWESWRESPRAHICLEVGDIARILWEKAGKPPNRDDEFWYAAEAYVKRRSTAATGYGGSHCESAYEAKRVAIEQFLRRKSHAAKRRRVSNETLPAGSPMYFYCCHCDILLETLPEDYLFPANSVCSQCKGLEGSGWLPDARDHLTGYILAG